MLRFPIERKLRAILEQRFRGEFWRLAALNDLLDDVRCQERETDHAAHVAFADPLALANFDHRSSAPGDEIVKPAVRACDHFQECGVSSLRSLGVAIDDGLHFDPALPHLHRDQPSKVEMSRLATRQFLKGPGWQIYREADAIVS